MKDILLLTIKKFLEERGVSARPLMLGYSGGPDSKALLKLLFQCQRFFPFELHLAHVDHGWREESQREAKEIELEAHDLKIPLHMHRLNMEDFSKGNWEEKGRKYRLTFFSEVYARIGAQALVLGHHADDQAEVVLKRVFEGSSFFSLGGLSPQSHFLGMQIWRPLLSIQKQDVLQWLSQKGICFFQDPTNTDTRFLRGKMRKDMLPLLSSSFGKEISSNLCHLGEESREIKAYFSKLNSPILSSLQKDDLGVHLDLNPFLPLPHTQVKYLLKEWFIREGASFSRQVLSCAAASVIHSAERKKFISSDGEIQIERGLIRFFKRIQSEQS